MIPKKKEWFTQSLIFGERPERIAHGCDSYKKSTNKFDFSQIITHGHSFVMSDLNDSLICPEWSERITHSCSFDLNNLCEWEMSQWVNSQPCPSPPTFMAVWNVPLLTLTHAAKGPKGLLCFEKQTAKHFLKLKKFKNLSIPGKLYVDYFPFFNN